MNRRHFVSFCLAGFATAIALPRISRAQSAARRELRITRIVVQPAVGRRLTPVAPNAYAPYRGYDRTEPVLRIQTAQGLEGIGRAGPSPEILKSLLGLDPFRLFEWTTDGRIAGPAAEHVDLVQRLVGADVALLDLLAKATNRPVAALLGPTVRESVPVYNSCVYMEDLLTPEQSANLVFLPEPRPSDPVEWVARKAAWVVGLPEGFKAIKIKLGRSKWMKSAAEADARDIAVTLAVRRAIGPGVKLYVDGNKDYATRPHSVAAYAEAVRGVNVSFMEEMFPESNTAALRELRQVLRAAKNPVKLAAGESQRGGIAESIYTQRVDGPRGPEPLIDIEQADMNQNGFLFIRKKAAAQRLLGMTFAPHNFGSKLGFYAQIHLGLTVPNWETSEVDDVHFPAFHADGIVVRNGVAALTGQPGLGVRLEESALGKPTVELTV